MANVFDDVGSKSSQKQMHQINGNGGSTKSGPMFHNCSGWQRRIFAFPVWQLIGRDGNILLNCEGFFPQRNIWTLVNLLQAPAQVLSLNLFHHLNFRCPQATGGRLPTSDRRKANVENCFQNRRKK